MKSADEAELRSIVRELLRELVPASRSNTRRLLEVRLDNDADVHVFVNRFIGMLDDPRTGSDIRSGALRFTMTAPRSESQPRVPAPAGPPEASAAPTATPVIHVEKGAVTERLVNQAVADGARILLGRRAVVTPLARESARRAGIELERP